MQTWSALTERKWGRTIKPKPGVRSTSCYFNNYATIAAINSWRLVGIRGGKKIYRYLKFQGQDIQGVSSLRDGHKLLIDAASKATVLNKQFWPAFTKDTPETAEFRFDGPDYPSLDILHIKVKVIEKLLAELNPSKAPGPDQIPSRILKTMSKALASSL